VTVLPERPPRPPGPRPTAVLLLLSVLLLLVAAFHLARYGPRYSETDTFTFTHHALQVLDQGSLTPRGAYPNGYGYPALLVFLARLSGLSLVALQRCGGALLAVVIVLPAFLLYRSLTPNRRAALLATLILLLQPDFLFPILRGTHEKFSRALMILALFLLVRYLRRRSSVALSAGLALGVYLLSYGQIAFNSFFANAYLAAITLALLLLAAAARPGRDSDGEQDPAPARLPGYLVLSLLVTVYLFVFHLYPPARDQILQLRHVADRLAALFLDVEVRDPGAPYRPVSGGWVNLGVYFAISAATWLLLVSSGLIWLGQTGRFLRSRSGPRGRRRQILWAFYGAFAALGAASIVVDLSGALAGNLQLRAFPACAILAAPVTATWLLERAPRPGQAARLARAGLWLALGLLLVFSTWKAANDPLVSNKWVFYEAAEARAIEWADGHLAENGLLWVSFDERLITRPDEASGAGERRIRLDVAAPDPAARDRLISSLTRAQANRLDLPLPVEAGSLITYDNGRAQIYHLRPRNPFQH
jgi:hypothetical protein